MKQCPLCGTTYTDPSLSFCLADGAALTVAEQETVVRSAAGQGMRVDIPPEAAAARFTATPPASSSSGAFKVLLVVLGLGILVVLLALIGTVVYYNTRSERAGDPTDGVKTPAPSPAASTRNEADDLRDQIADLQKQLAEQKSPPAANSRVPIPAMRSTSLTTSARVNSPGDGFLALRSLPSSTVGERILKIPHGASVSVGACGPTVRGIHPGRWCQARYGGSTGYIYDYYVVY